MRRRYAGSWEMTSILRSGRGAVSGCARLASVSVDEGIPAAHRGEEEDLRAFFAMVTERLGKPAQVN